MAEISSSRPVSRLTSLHGKSMMVSCTGGVPAITSSEACAATEVEHEMGGELGAGHAELRIDAAFETIARIAVDAEPAAGLRDIERIPQRRFDQHVGRAFVAARMLPADDAGERFDTVVVGDHHHRLVEFVGPAVERRQFFAGTRAAHDEIAGDLLRIEDMQRPAAIESEVVGDVDERVDGTQPDRRQPLLQPLRRGTILHAAHEAQHEQGREMAIAFGEVEPHGDRRGKAAFDRLQPMAPSSGRGRRRRGRGRCRARLPHRDGSA